MESKEGEKIERMGKEREREIKHSNWLKKREGKIEKEREQTKK